MRFCHACQTELDATSLAAGRCANCGAVIRALAQRSLDDKNQLHQLKPGDEDASEESVDIEMLGESHIGATLQFSPVDTKQDPPAAKPPQADKPPEKASDPQRKSPTVTERADMTIEFKSPEDAARDSKSTIDSTDIPSPRRTHAIESDMTMDLASLPPEERQRLESEWGQTVDPGSKQGHTIRQRDTVTSHRSSLPVKSRFIREKKKNGTTGPRPTSPAEVPDYELLEVIGEGGMGVVYAAHQSSIARTVAVKMLKPSAKVGEEQRDKFISEAVVTGELDHPNIVPIYDLGANDAGALFYSMKRVKGTPWDKVVHQKSLDDNLSILLRVADAVAFAHAHGVVHRDLKPENVMLGDYGEVLVMDWGLARITMTFANADAIFQADSLGGTPAYMAPEMARGPVDSINFTSDIYLLGAILYEIIGGKPPHSGRDVMQCLMNAAQNQIDGIRYEGELKSIALRAMATRQEDRYPSVKDFQEAVRVYQSHSESLVLTAHANLSLQKARESGDYQFYARALYGFQESLNLWDNNHRARTLLAETQRDYAKAAMDKGDLDLAASLLDAKNPEQAPLLEEIEVARRERDARQRRLRRAKQLVAGLAAAVVGIITVSLFIVNQQRQRAVAAEQVAVAAEKDAVEQRDVAVSAKEQEEVQRQEAERQKVLADQQRERAEAQEKIAVHEADRARTEEQNAVREKEAKEYEEYVAKIGLASAKINDNAFEYATDLLNECAPQLRNWEWGRLAHLCRLGAGSFQAAGPVDAVAYSPDGSRIAIGDWGGQISVRDAHNGQPIFSDKHGQYVHAVAFSPDGKRLATGSSDKLVRIVDATNGQVQQTLAGHGDGVVSVEFSPDGKQLLTSSYDKTAKLWDLATGETLQTFQGHSDWVWEAKFSPLDASRIVTTGQDGKAIVWRKTQAGSATPYEMQITFIGHDGAVYAAAFSPDGKLVATGGYDKLVMIWNPDEVPPVDLRARIEGQPEPKPNYLRLAGHDGPVRSVAFSPNGQLVASGSDDNAVRLWDVAKGESVKILRGHGNAVHACRFSPDGKFVLSGGQDSAVVLWDLAGYQEVRVLHATVLSGHNDAILSARFSPDGSEIVTASRDRTAGLWDTNTGKNLRQFAEGHEFLATSAAFFPAGERLATGAGDNSVRIWNVARGTQLATLAPTGRLGTLAVSPDGKMLATGSPGNDAKIWDAEGGKAIATLTGHPAEVSATVFSPDGKLLATGDDRGKIRLWQRRGDSGQWETVHELLGHSRSITAMRFTPDGKRLVSSSGDRSCGQWDVATGQELRQLVLKHPEWISGLDVSPDGTQAITTCDDGQVRVWRLADAQIVRTYELPNTIFNAVGYAPDGNSALLTSSTGRKVQRISLAGGVPGAAQANAGSSVAANRGSSTANALAEPVAPMTADAGETVLDFGKLGGVVWSAMFARDGQHILTIGGNDAELWNLETHRPTMRFSPHGAVASAALSPDGKMLVTGSWDHSAKLWDAATGRAIRKLEGGHTGYINTAEFSPDGSEVLTASDDGTARLWTVATGKPAAIVFRGHGGRVLGGAYSPDGREVLTVSGDKTARIWDHQSGQPLKELAGHKWAVLCGQFSPDGKRIVTGSQDTTAKIWDAVSGKELVPLAGHTAAVTSVAFSPDGSRVLTGSQDNTVKLWDANTGKEILSLTGHEQEVTSVAFSPDGKLALSSSRDGRAIVWLAVDWRQNAPLHTAASQ